jgi:hypothetical protein
MPTPPLPPEALTTLLSHLRKAGREVALGLQATVELVRRGLAEQSDGGRLDASAAALDDALRRVEQGLGFLVMLAPEGEADPEATRAAREEVLDRIVGVVEAIRRDRERAGAPTEQLAALDEVLATLRRERNQPAD